ncbi:glycosyltransferase family 2 protein [Desmospora activa]|nr:glycosyltransferase family 2 protein [Desmospora activa]
MILRHAGSILQLRQALSQNLSIWMKRGLVEDIVLLIGSASGSPTPPKLEWTHGIQRTDVSGNHWGDAMNNALNQLSSHWICSVSTDWLSHPTILEDTLIKLKQQIQMLPQGASIRVEGKNQRPLFCCWNGPYVKKHGGWPSKKEWPFSEQADDFLWSTLPFSAKTRVTLDWNPLHPGGSVWEREKQKWIDHFLGGLEQAQPRQTATTQPTISILLPVYNGADTISWTITSALYQTHPDFELIVIDDGSNDTTAKEVRKFDDPRIRWLPRPVNRGKVYCLNEAWQKTRGKWLLELDADDWLSPEALAWVQRSVQEVPPEVALLYGDRIFWQEDPTGRLICRTYRKGYPIQSFQHYLNDLTPVGPRIYRREAICQIGGWPVDDYGEGRLYEDIRVVLKLLETHQIRYVPGSHYHVRLRADSVSHKNANHFSAWKEWLLCRYSSNRS